MHQELGRFHDASTHFEVLSALGQELPERPVPKNLFRWDNELVSTGDSMEIAVEPGQWLRITRASVKPAVFVIDDFLSDRECEVF